MLIIVMNISPIISLLTYTATVMIIVITTVTGADAQLAEVASQVLIVEMAAEACGCVVTIGVSPAPCSSLPWNASCTERELCSILIRTWKRSK